MAQLTDDCFAFGGELQRLDAAVAELRARLAPATGTETLPLFAASGRVLAADVTARLDAPPRANSAVDGYAVASRDLAPGGPTRLPLAGRAAAGHAAPALAPGTAVRVFTGAPLPAGADTVFMQEDVERENDGAEPGTVRLPPGLKRGANARQRGEDIAAGDLALPAGRRLRPQDLALAAAAGHAALPVRVRLRVAVLSTGDELAEPGGPLGPAEVPDANRVMLLALVARLGCEPIDLGIARDDAQITAARLTQGAARADAIVTSGGVSTGEEDHLKAALARAGSLDRWRVAIKPGRPVALGVVRGVPLIGLPGNPAAAFVTFVALARPMLDRLAGAEPSDPAGFTVRAAFAHVKKGGRREFVRVRLARGADGVVEAHRHPREGAGIVTSLTETDALADLPEDLRAVAPGDLVTVRPYEGLI